MYFTFDTCYTVVNCVNEYRINLFNKRPKIKFNRGRKIIDITDDGEFIPNSECERVALRRAKLAVVDLGLCNNFDFFGTITLSDDKVGDLIQNPQFIKDWITKTFDNYRQQIAPEFRYILVPEYGKKTNRLHFHFVCKGIPKDDLFINAKHHLDWHLTTDRFGFTHITRIKASRLDKVRVAKYCAKYLSKDSLKICNHRYFASKDLKRPERSIIENDDEAMLISEWLEVNGFPPYCDMEYARCFSLPARVYEDLCAYLEELRKPKKAYLIDLPDSILSPWDFGFNPRQMNYREVIA